MPSKPVLLALFGALLAAAQCIAVTVGVELWTRDERAPEVEATLYATPIVAAVGNDDSGKLSHPLRAPFAGEISLPEGKTWKIEIEVEAAEYWSQPTVVTTAGTEDPSIRIELHPTGLVAGALKFPSSKEQPPSEVLVHFSSRERRTGEAEGFRGTSKCPVKDRQWRCHVPRGFLDVRLQIPGFVSHFFFDQEVTVSKPLNFGELTFVRGSSLGGFVRTEDDSPITEECCSLSLSPQASGPGEASRQLKGMALKAPVNQFGFFLFDGVAPGAYIFEATHKKLTKITVDPIVIHPETETFLRDTLIFRRPVDATISITPPVDAAGKSWQLELMATKPTFSPAGSGKTDASGNWRRSGLQPGKYLLMVSDSSGTGVAFEELEMTREAARFDFALRTVWVEGRVAVEGEGLAASLFFGGVSGPVSVRMDSDEEGEFAGYLPKDGEWEVDVRAKDRSIFRRLRNVEVKEDQTGNAHVEINLPDTLLEVEVVDENGRPVGGAMVLVLRYPPTEKPSFDRTDAEGMFSVRGLDYSEFRIQAQSMSPYGLLLSEPITISLSENAPSTSVQLTIRRTEKLRGRVLASVGTAVPGARIEIEGPVTGGLLNMLVQGAQTGHDGSFAIDVPPDIQKVAAIVLAPGFVLTTVDLPTDSSREHLIQLSQDGGGTLAVELAEPTGLVFGNQPSVDLTYDGRVAFDAGILSNWAGMNGLASPEPLMLQVPLMPAGSYSACWTTHSENGSEKECSQGFLSPNGILELSRNRSKGSG